ncbi:MAG: DEAD/DEAH box helicase family protein [Eubacteriales bacterium]|nr:DEAD/DEAH box helicase family protein [Eubacteriales bacterium]
MKLQFKHQKLQADAAKAVCDVFAGQPYLTPTYMMDRGTISRNQQMTLTEEEDYTGFRNQPIVPELNDAIILDNINKIQRTGQLAPSKQLEGHFNLTIEMETGVGKTYTYIKTMFELNKRYGWSKFIVVVPSVAIREGVYKSFDITQDHFAEEYNKKIRFFIYNSAQLTEIDRFASDSAINVMIINSQAFNATGKDARRIYMKLDEFRSRRPIDILAKTNPILIIDEPQSVEGEKTKLRLKEFQPLFTLRYSATHRKDSIYNMVYRLDAMEAYNKKLVKKIEVKGISISGSTATEGYLYLQSVNLFKDKAPTATIEFDVKGATGVRKTTRIVAEGFNLFDQSGGLEEYKTGYIVSRIDGRDNSVSFVNGKKIFAGDAVGEVSEEQLRRIQIRETIQSHIERERRLFYKGIKVLSLFFIDEVAKYKQYDAAGKAINGQYAEIFEEEYQNALNSLQLGIGEDDYIKYLTSISAEQTHAGYFSIDKKSHRLVDSKLGDKKARTSDDADAYDLIMKDKERLLDRKEPVRFIFSHSALREGWDNPNVFQICTLKKQSESEIRGRQEIGRGLRLSVNQNGERMDAGYLGEDVQVINQLTVVTDWGFEPFVKAYQTGLAEAVADRPRAVTVELFKNKVIKDAEGNEQVVDADMAQAIYESLIVNGYIRKGILTDKYYDDKKNGAIEVAEEAAGCTDSVVSILDTIYDARAAQPENARANNVELRLDNDKLNRKEFQELWKRINVKSAYVVNFDTDELIEKCICALDRDLHVASIYFKVETGSMAGIASKEQLKEGAAFKKDSKSQERTSVTANTSVKYDLVGKIVAETGLTRAAVVRILKGISPAVFGQFSNNPEEFIIKASALINDQKATVIIQHITYNKLEAVYDTDIFTEPTMKGRLGYNAMEAHKHLYDYILYDSTNERDFATELDTSNDVAVYVKLPSGFFISTPVGKYNPDWAIAFYEGTVKHIYFVAETKGSMSSMQLRLIEDAKIHCAREHFKSISTDVVKYDVVDSYESLMAKVMQ